MALRTEALHHIEPFKLQGMKEGHPFSWEDEHAYQRAASSRMKEGHPFSWEDEHAYGRAASSKDLAADTKTSAGPRKDCLAKTNGEERGREISPLDRESIQNGHV